MYYSPGNTHEMEVGSMLQHNRGYVHTGETRLRNGIRINLLVICGKAGLENHHSMMDKYTRMKTHNLKTEGSPADRQSPHTCQP